MSPQTEEALKAEIARLSGAINAHKAGKTGTFSSRSNFYLNPHHKPPSKLPFRSKASTFQRSLGGPATASPSSQPRDVVIDGVAFQSSKHSLVRKDLAKPPSTSKPSSSKSVQPPRHEYARKYPGTRSIQRPYKSKASRRVPRNNNMTLENGRKPIRVGRKTKSIKYVDKQCPRFSTTGVCTKGLICCYKHDPAKIAICWPFLNGTCPNTSESCSLSHDPIAERTPLCVHFANNGRCKNGNECLFPHVRVGPRKGICRDFAVLGYCEKGIDCENQHVRECPDFAEKGACPNPRCKLPHVIRANNQRRSAEAGKAASCTDTTAPVAPAGTSEKSPESSGQTYVEDGNIGDEFISLTFHESENSEDEEEDDSEETGSDEDADGGEDEDGESEDDQNIKKDELEVHP
ncbi:hypothetical protein ACEPAF_610 [Sanghuangporus sanghuang]